MADNKENIKKPISKFTLINYKRAMRLVTIVVGLLMIVFMTLSQIAFDPDHFNVATWVSNSLIMIGISVFGILMGESIGSDRLESNPFGLYQYTLKQYNGAKNDVEPYIPYFSGYYIKHNERELVEKKADFLIRNGFDGDEAIAIATHLKTDDLDIIFNEAIYRKDSKGRDICLCKIDSSKREIIEDLFLIDLNVAGYSYFLTANNKVTSLGIAENSIILPKMRNASRSFNRIYKIVVSTVFSLVWAMFTVKEFANGSDTQAWMNLISRLVQFLTSFVTGWGSSTIDIKLACDELENKILMLKEYYTAIINKDYIPETYQQRFEREMKEAEMVKENMKIKEKEPDNDVEETILD